MTATTARLSSRALIKLAGPDWRSFLQGLVTRDLADSRDDALLYTALLAPQGRLLHDFFVWTLGAEEGVLDVDASAAPSLAETLQRYRLRAKVTIEPLFGAVEVAFGGAPYGEGWRGDPRLDELGWRRLHIGDPSAEAGRQAEADYETLRLRVGATDPVRDARANDYPLELNFDLLNGVDFKKGCFIGQETTSRMHRRGGVRSRLVPVTFAGAAPTFGADVMCAGLRVGDIRSGGDGRALAMLRLDRAYLGALEAEGVALTLDPQAWLLDRFKPATPTDTFAVP